MKLVACVIALAGCNQLFGVEQTELAPLGDAAIDCDVLPGHPSFHDEDDDDYADLCDNCIGMPNPNQADADGDDIGDVCDPQAGTVDSVLAQFTFVDQMTMTDWTPLLGRWRIADDAMISEDTTNLEEVDAFYNRERFSGSIAIETRVTVDSIGAAPSTDYKFGIQTFVDAGGDNGFECMVTRSWDAGTTQHRDEVTAYVPGLGRNDNLLVSNQLGDGASYRLRLKFDGSQFQCAVEGALGDGGSANHTVTGVIPSSDHVGLISETIAVRYHYVVVYRLGS